MLGIYDKAFFLRLTRLALPVSLQVLLFTSVTMIDVVMLGQLGETDVAAAGLADKALFLVYLALFGASTGANILGSQYWGAKNGAGLRRTLALASVFTLVFALAFSALFVGFAEDVIGLGATDPSVIAKGSTYLRWLGFSMIGAAVLLPLEVGLRCIDRARIPTYYGVLESCLNVILNYALIFGQLGAPALGIEGAAIGSLIARSLRVVLLVAHVRLWERDVAWSLGDLKAAFERSRASRFTRLTLPVAFNHVAWAGGVFTFQLLYGRMGVRELATMTMLFAVQRLTVAAVSGLGVASSIMVGHELGARRPREAFRAAVGCLGVSIGAGLLFAVTLGVLRDPMLDLFRGIDEPTRALAVAVYPIMLVELVLRAANMVMIVGALRAGGETAYCLFVDVTCAWLVALPLAATAALVYDAPLTLVYGVALSEEVTKLFLVGSRLLRRRWLNNLIEDESAPAAAS